MTIAYLVTHSGSFHADELLSSVILTHLFPHANIVRTRDDDWITAAPDRVVYDVGGDYDPCSLVFDHHQKNPPLRSDCQPYSSFGLVWRHFGKDYLRSFGVPNRELDTIHAAVDTSFVLAIDLADNGAMSVSGPMANLSLPLLLESLKPAFDDRSPNATDRAFGHALTIARAFLEATINREAAKLRAEAVVMAAIADAGESRVLELPMEMPFRAAVEKTHADHLLFVVYPREDDWTLNGIRREAQRLSFRASLPEEWAGLTGAAFEVVSGVCGARFCHNGRFIAVAADRTAALKLAAKAVERTELSKPS